MNLLGYSQFSGHSRLIQGRSLVLWTKGKEKYLATKYLKWKRQNNLNGKIFQQTKYLPFRRTEFQPQTPASLRVCWVWTSFHNFTLLWEWWKTHWNFFSRKNCSFFGLDSWWRSLRFNQVQNISCEPFFIWVAMCPCSIFLQDALFQSLAFQFLCKREKVYSLN